MFDFPETNLHLPVLSPKVLKIPASLGNWKKSDFLENEIRLPFKELRNSYSSGDSSTYSVLES